MHDEELAAGAVGVHGACHADHAAGVLERIVHAVCSKLALDVPAGAAGAVAQRAAALDHKAGDHAVEGQAVVKPSLTSFLKFSQVIGAASSFSSISMMPPSSIVMRTITLQYSFCVAPQQCGSVRQKACRISLIVYHRFWGLQRRRCNVFVKIHLSSPPYRPKSAWGSGSCGIFRCGGP